MKSKVIIKRIVALFLTVCMVSATCMVDSEIKAKAEDTADVLLENSKEAGWERYTLRDFGIADGSLSQMAASREPLDGTLDKTLFQAKMYFPTAEKDTGNLYWGGSDYNGIALGGNGSSLVMYVISQSAEAAFEMNPEFAGASLFGNRDLEVTISTEFVNPKDGAGTADLKIGVWFNGRLYKGEYFTASGITMGDFTKNLHHQGNLDNEYEAYSFKTPLLYNNSQEKNFEKLTLRDFGIDKGAITVGENTALAGTIDETVFRAKMNFTGAMSGNLYLGGSGYNGIAINSDGTNIFLYVISGDETKGQWAIEPSIAGMTLCGTDELEFAISTEFIESDGTNAKLKLGVWLNGELYDGRYLISKTVAVADFTRNMHGQGLTGKLVGNSIIEKKYLKDSPEAEFTKYTLYDFGIDGGSLDVIGSETKNLGGTIDKTLFQAKMYFPSSGFNNVYWGGTGWNGIAFAGNGTGLTMYVVSNGKTIEKNVTSEAAGVTICDNDSLNFAISAEFINEESGLADLKIGLWFNGVLYDGEYWIVENVTTSEFPIHLHSELKIPETLKGYSISEVQILDETKYTHYTLSDVGIPDGKGGVFGRFAKADWGGSDYDKVLMEAEVTFVNEGGRIHYATPVGVEFDGIQIRLQGESLIVEDYNPDLAGTMQYSTVEIEPTQFGFTTFVNQTITLKLTTDVVCRNGGEKDDVQLGIWINDKLANNRYCYINDQLSKFGECMNFSQDTEMVRYSLWDLKAPTGEMIQYVQLKGDAPYLVEADTLTGNDKNYQNGDEVSEPGDYKATYEADERTAAAEKEVVLWKSYDLHADGKYDSRDLIAIKKLKAGTRPTSKAGIKAAENISSTGALELIRRYFIGEETSLEQDAPTLYYQVDHEGKVMPISSWVTPALWLGYTVDANGNYVNDYTQYGVETNFLQDKYYEMIQDLGINHIVYQEKNYAESNEYQILKGLELAEKFNINFYVHDTGIADTETDKAILAERLKQYSRYSSFAGIHVTDEPKTDYFNATVPYVQTLDEIANKTSLLNSYSNLTGFVNLSTSTDYTAFTQYVDEYIAKCSPRILSFDNYPFTPGNDQQHFVNVLKVIREKSLANNIPFSGCVGTSTTTWNTAPNTEVNTTTQAQVNWSVNTLLAFGAKGYTWFTLVQPRNFAQVGSEGNLTGMDYDRAGLIGADGSKTPVYALAKNVNAWTAMVDAVLMESKSVAVLADGDDDLKAIGSGNTYRDMTFSLKDTSDCDSCEDGAIVGVFDYNGKTAYYVTNYDSNHSREVKLAFEHAKAMTIYDQSTMQVSYEDNQAECEFNLPAGGAVLVIAE